MSMNSKLHAIINSAESHGVCLDKATLDFAWGTITVKFRQERQTRREMRDVKRWVDGFEKFGNPPYVKLRKHIKVPYTNGHSMETEDLGVEVVWEDAFKCNISYDCRPAKFSGDEDDEVESFSGAN